MRGGARKGAGRPRKEGDRVAFRCELPRDAMEILKRKAEEKGITRTEFLARILRNCKK